MEDVSKHTFVKNDLNLKKVEGSKSSLIIIFAMMKPTHLVNKNNLNLKTNAYKGSSFKLHGCYGSTDHKISTIDANLSFSAF